jgi:hypothetical protein
MYFVVKNSNKFVENVSEEEYIDDLNKKTIYSKLEKQGITLKILDSMVKAHKIPTEFLDNFNIALRKVSGKSSLSVSDIVCYLEDDGYSISTIIKWLDGDMLYDVKMDLGMKFDVKSMQTVFENSYINDSIFE